MTTNGRCNSESHTIVVTDMRDRGSQNYSDVVIGWNITFPSCGNGITTGRVFSDLCSDAGDGIYGERRVRIATVVKGDIP